MNFSQISRSVLSMNARNLEYLMKHNTKAHKRLADDKLFTKNFLSARGIGVAKLFHHIKNPSQLSESFLKSLPKDFVLKPNRGFAGGGITVVTKHTKNAFYTPSGKKITNAEFFQRIIEILEGKYSISGVGDTALIEERLISHDFFTPITEVGLPDIRMIVFNNVPVLAMARIPTEESEGKANMELGAIALGIDIATGETTGGAYYKDYITRLPNGLSARGHTIPFWDEILLACSRIQSITKIGYLGVDLVITPSGVKVLELNARSGLKIQIANKIGLRSRLNKIKDLKISSPEEGVRLAKTLFAQKSTKIAKKDERPIIGLTEWGFLNGENPRQIKILLNPTQETSIADASTIGSGLLDLTVAKKRIKIAAEKGYVPNGNVILGKNALKGFLLDPQKPFEAHKKVKLTNTKALERLKEYDKRQSELAERFKMLSFINPQNIEEQKALFLGNRTYNPQFLYRKKDVLPDLLKDLKKLPEVDHELFPLWKERTQELILQVQMAQKAGTPDFAQAATQVFLPPTASELSDAEDFIKNTEITEDQSPVLNTSEAEKVLKDYLATYKLNHWGIKMLSESAVDIQVSKKQNILLRKGATFTENRLKALLVHEIGTHVFRFENGRRQPWRILERGTANYLETEEGMAIWNQNQLKANTGRKRLGAALHIITNHYAKSMPFAELFAFLQENYQCDDAEAWKHCLKAKRGLKDTANLGGFTKDVLYFRGEQSVIKFLAQKGDMKELYTGKFHVSHLDLVKKLPDLVEGKFMV